MGNPARRCPRELTEKPVIISKGKIETTDVDHLVSFAANKNEIFPLNFREGKCGR